MEWIEFRGSSLRNVHVRTRNLAISKGAEGTMVIQPNGFNITDIGVPVASLHLPEVAQSPSDNLASLWERASRDCGRDFAKIRFAYVSADQSNMVGRNWSDIEIGSIDEGSGNPMVNYHHFSLLGVVESSLKQRLFGHTLCYQMTQGGVFGGKTPRHDIRDLA